jgi:hypothetical protein
MGTAVAMAEWLIILKQSISAILTTISWRRAQIEMDTQTSPPDERQTKKLWFIELGYPSHTRYVALDKVTEKEIEEITSIQSHQAGQATYIQKSVGGDKGRGREGSKQWNSCV